MKHPELNEQAKQIATVALQSINKAAMITKDNNMPYKAQYILEEVIKILKEQV